MKIRNQRVSPVEAEVKLLLLERTHSGTGTFDHFGGLDLIGDGHIGLGLAYGIHHGLGALGLAGTRRRLLLLRLLLLLFRLYRLDFLLRLLLLLLGNGRQLLLGGCGCRCLLFGIELLQMNGSNAYEGHIAILNKGLEQLLAQAAQLMAMLNGESHFGELLAQLHILKLQEIHIWWEGAQQVEYIVTSIVANDALALDGGAQLDGLIPLIEHRVWQYLQMLARQTQQLQIFGMTEDCLAKIYGAIDNRLFLFPLQNAGYDGLGGDTIATIINDNGAESVETFDIHSIVDAHAMEIVTWRHKGGMIAAKFLVVIADIKAQREEDVVPDEHLHFGILAGINGQHIAIDDGHRSTSCRRHKVAMHLEDGTFAQQTLWQCLPWQFPSRLQLLVPVARLSRYVFLIAARETERLI